MNGSGASMAASGSSCETASPPPCPLPPPVRRMNATPPRPMEELMAIRVRVPASLPVSMTPSIMARSETPTMTNALMAVRYGFYPSQAEIIANCVKEAFREDQEEHEVVRQRGAACHGHRDEQPRVELTRPGSVHHEGRRVEGDADPEPRGCPRRGSIHSQGHDEGYLHAVSEPGQREGRVKGEKVYGHRQLGGACRAQ